MSKKKLNVTENIPESAEQSADSANGEISFTSNKPIEKKHGLTKKGKQKLAIALTATAAVVVCVVASVASYFGGYKEGYDAGVDSAVSANPSGYEQVVETSVLIQGYDGQDVVIRSNEDVSFWANGWNGALLECKSEDEAESVLSEMQFSVVNAEESGEATDLMKKIEAAYSALIDVKNGMTFDEKSGEEEIAPDPDTTEQISSKVSSAQAELGNSYVVSDGPFGVVYENGTPVSAYVEIGNTKIPVPLKDGKVDLGEEADLMGAEIDEEESEVISTTINSLIEETEQNVDNKGNSADELKSEDEDEENEYRVR